MRRIKDLIPRKVRRKICLGELSAFWGKKGINELCRTVQVEPPGTAGRSQDWLPYQEARI